jgi:hypothetical protein
VAFRPRLSAGLAFSAINLYIHQKFQIQTKRNAIQASKFIMYRKQALGKAANREKTRPEILITPKKTPSTQNSLIKVIDHEKPTNNY